MDATGLPDGWPWAGACRVPRGLSGERLARWLERRTRQEQRRAVCEGRPWSGGMRRRRLERRLSRALSLEDGSS